MSLLIDQLAAYLQVQGEGTVGTNIFKLQRPSSPAACVSIHATGGYPPERYGKRTHPTIQLIARATTPNGALVKAARVFAKLQDKQNVDLGGGLWALTIEPMSDPAYIGEELAGNQTCHLASFNITIDLRTPSS